MNERLAALRHGLMVSCQAADGDPFHGPASMARFAQAAVESGAAGIRANGAEDIAAIRATVSVPILGLHKEMQADGRILITPRFEYAAALVRAGADFVALDCTRRGQAFGALDRLRRVRAELGVPVVADIARIEEALAAVEAGADAVASTMRGYSPETEDIRRFEPEFIRALAGQVRVPVIAEGMIHAPEQAAAALRAGAFAVVVGKAISAPGHITARFAAAMDREAGRLPERHIIGVDLGGTQTKFGLVSSRTGLVEQGSIATPAGGRDVLLAHLERVAVQALERARADGFRPSLAGIATAGWVNPADGSVVYATENLPGWTGAGIAAALHPRLGIPVAVENDANALAVAERWFGAGRDVDNFVCVTLGTGVGGGCYVNGRLHHGSHFFANAIGHVMVERDGLPCTCGLRGCLEPYANSAALLRYGASGGYADAGTLIRAAGAGEEPARQAIRTQAGYLAAGLASIIHLLDPERIILSGGLAQENPLLFEELEIALRTRVTVWPQRRISLLASPLGYHGGVLGAAACALEMFEAV
ncbi:MAG: putative N-acetylmannosamine-6-phosphate 2-epimerase [Bryobacterales bacterium]|nr:putative N-acetylmannosamine-6-phosphate 2-epimerase [Bryobacterales bacterium]